MVGAYLFVHAHERLTSIAGLPSSVPFTGVSILTVGDFQPLSPVCEAPVNKVPQIGLHALAALSSSNFSVFGLTEIMQ